MNSLKRIVKFASCLATALLVPTAMANAADFRLSLPVACDLGKNCFVQNYVDIIPGKDRGDFACGKATYDGHKGTDFRVLSTKDTRQSVKVLAAAPGVVRAVRDEITDALMAKQLDPKLKGRECGNGVVIDHGSGWQTQYCHLRRGTVSVAKGDRVIRGQAIAAIGYSGAAQFAHLHLSVRQNGKVVDPYSGAHVGMACNPNPIDGLWQQAAIEKLTYQRGQLIENGFSNAPVNSQVLENGAVVRPRADAPALVYFGRFINLEKGDVIRLSLTGPKGINLNNETKPLDRAKAQYVAYIGKKRRTKSWPTGLYKGTVHLVRNGNVVVSKVAEFALAD